jgi:hypothetical protein
VFRIPQSSNYWPEVLDHGKTLAPERPISQEANVPGQGQRLWRTNIICKFCREEQLTWSSLLSHIKTSHPQEYLQVEVQLDFEFGEQVEKDSLSTDDIEHAEDPAAMWLRSQRRVRRSIVRRIRDWFGL